MSFLTAIRAMRLKYRRGLTGLVFTLTMSLQFALVLHGQTITSPEYQVKAVFLFNFSQFVEWPATAFPGAQAPLVIGVLGDDPFGSYLDETVQGEKVNGHPLEVRRLQSAQDARSCHILFINWGNTEKLKGVFTDLKGSSVLTVGDAADFARQGGVVRFFTENSKIRILINLEAAKAAELTISSKLLRLARIVGSKDN
jgi:hypothetical protein